MFTIGKISEYLIIIIGSGLILPVIFAIRNYYQFKGDSPKWHLWQGVLQILFFAVLGFVGNWWAALSAAFFYWAFFDSLTGWLIAGDFFYLGTAAKTDRIWRKVFKGLAGEMSFIIKMLLGIGFSVIYFVTNH